MSDETRTGAAQTSVLGPRWITVDLDRIRRLPHRLRCLWPRNLRPDLEAAAGQPAAARAGLRGAADAAFAAAGAHAASPTPTALAELPAEVVRPRDLDVLSAWLAGFAAELNLTRSRITVVFGAPAQTLVLELAVSARTCLAILALHGEDCRELAGFELLRRLDPTEVAEACEDLGDLVDGDCVLTLTYAGLSGTPEGGRRSGMEFLHRRGGDWSRPLLARGVDGVTIAQTEAVPDGAVRTLVAAVLTCLLGPEAGLP